MLSNTGTLTVELIVLGARELLGAFGAVVALGGAAGAEGGCSALGAQGHARRGAGEDALGKHAVGGGGRVEMGGVVQLGVGGGLDEVARTGIDEAELGL
jgi:hypothetical protein